jgi:hypothetical protein
MASRTIVTPTATAAHANTTPLALEAYPAAMIETNKMITIAT